MQLPFIISYSIVYILFKQWLQCSRSRPFTYLHTEAQVSPKIITNHQLFLDYKLLISFRRYGGICTYLHSQYERPDIICLTVNVKSSTKFICFVYQSSNYHSFNKLFDFLSMINDSIISILCLRLLSLVIFNVSNKDKLGSTTTNP